MLLTRLSAMCRAFASIPGPVPSFPLGNSWDFLRRPAWEVLADYAERHGPLVVFWFGPVPGIYLHAPELLSRVFESDFARYYKHNPAPALLPFLSEKGEFPTNDAVWEAARRNDLVPVLLPVTSWDTAGAPRGPMPVDIAATRAMLGQQVESLVRRTEARPIDLRPALVRLGFDVLSMLSFGKLLVDKDFKAYALQTELANQRMHGFSTPLVLHPRVRAAQWRWHARLREVVAEARREPRPGGDLLRLMLARGTRQSDADLATALSNIFFGGSQSVASAILSTLYLLSNHPEAGERVRAEVRALAARERAYGFAALEACEALEHAVLEALRLYPPAPLFMRNTRKEGATELGGYTLPPDTTLYASPWGLQRSPARYERPAEFVPERWAHGGKERDPLGSPYYFPFGLGRRTCAGQRLGLLAVKLAVAELLIGARPEVGVGQAFEPELYFGVLLPKALHGTLRRG